MKTNKGFTLIELLAVIVILAIIALIATPIILSVIEDARQGAAESSALGYIDTVEKQILIDEMKKEAGSTTTPASGISGYADSESGKTFATSAITLENIKGDQPTAGTITVKKDGEVGQSCLVINGYAVNYNGQKVVKGDTEKGGECDGAKIKESS